MKDSLKLFADGESQGFRRGRAEVMEKVKETLKRLENKSVAIEYDNAKNEYQYMLVISISKVKREFAWVDGNTN
jgi:hypothetical protein